MKKFELSTYSMRKSPDPVFKGANRYTILVSVTEVPLELPTDPNPRQAEINKSIWKEITRSLMNEDETPNTFHLKNKGITIIANSVEEIKIGQKDKIRIICEEGQGILDGGHTYKLITEKKEEIIDYNEEHPESIIDQYVKIEILTGLPKEIPIAEIAGGLNTGTQVKLISLANLDNKYQWIKEELQNESYLSKIAFRENEDSPYDVTDILTMLELFNVKSYPNKGVAKIQPVKAYSSKSSVAKLYDNNSQNYEALRPILKDVLFLYDTINNDAQTFYNQDGRKFGASSLSLKHKDKYDLYFLNKKSKDNNSLHKAAMYPILASFRYFVEYDEQGKAFWKNGFEAVIKMWQLIGPDLLEITAKTNTDSNRSNVVLLGRDSQHWLSLFQAVKVAYLESFEPTYN